MVVVPSGLRSRQKGNFACPDYFLLANRCKLYQVSWLQPEIASGCLEVNHSELNWNEAPTKNTCQSGWSPGNTLQRFNPAHLQPDD
jgi:hypothetical protein